MSEVVIARETLANMLESGFEALLARHWEEVAHDKESIKLDPDWQGYREDEATGRLVLFAARRDGVLIGYNAFFVIRSRHYKTKIFGINDVIYILPEERGIVGVRLIVEAEKWLKAIGTAKIFYHTKTDAILGTQSRDSLEAMEETLDICELTGVDPDNWEKATEKDKTLGGVLRAMGYRHFENHFGKLLAEGG